jgi:energy-coupling factor transporter ATP-binding protein EcfA2
MSFNFEGRGVPIARLGKKIIYLDENDSQGIKVLEASSKDEFEIIPSVDENHRSCIFVTGPSGCGKSTFCSNYRDLYMKIYPDRKVYIFSKLKKDKSLDDDNERIKRFTPDDFTDDDVDVDYEQFGPSLLIFDDIQQIEDKKIKNKFLTLQNQVLELGRHLYMECLLTGHVVNNYRDTIIPLNESKFVIVYPNSGFQKIKNYLSRNVGLSNKEISNIKKLNSRWVAVHQRYPTFIVSAKKMYIV